MWCVCWEWGVGIKRSVAPGLTHGCCWEWVSGTFFGIPSCEYYKQHAMLPWARCHLHAVFKAPGRHCGSLSHCVNPEWALVKLPREAFWGLFLPDWELLSLLSQSSFCSPGCWACGSESSFLSCQHEKSSAPGFGAENVARNFAFCGCYQMVIM